MPTRTWHWSLIGWWLWLSGMGVVTEARADLLVLVHGYLSGEDAWQRSGVTGELEQVGWQAGGSVTVDGRQAVHFVRRPVAASRLYHVADLPSEAPLLVQAEALEAVMRAIRKRRGMERIILVGHSAGGVVARLYMVRNPTAAVAMLVTIAAPHLGTDKAEVAGLIASTPFSMMAPMVGLDTLNRSRSLYADLTRERPGTFLHWLNDQTHPKARYVSVVRRDGVVLSGDNTVPVWSQDMTRVRALKDQTPMVVVSGEDHALARQDGVELVRLLPMAD